MAPKFHLYLLQGSFYSGALASICTLTHEPWPAENNLAIIGFWLGFTVPFGLAWGKVNKLFKTAAKLNVTAPTFVTSKGIGLDLVMNQIGYQLAFTPALFAFLNKFARVPTPPVAVLEEKFKMDEQEALKGDNIDNQIKLWEDVINFRTKIICGSLLTDIFLLKAFESNSSPKRLIGIFNTKNFALMLSWHTFLLFRYFKDLRKPLNKENV
jgi:hypothetical protein